MKDNRSAASKTNTPASLNRSYGAPEVVVQRQRTLTALDLGRGDSVLDVGCGTGFLTIELAAAVGPDGMVTAIDHSQDMVAATVERCATMAQVRVEEGDVTRLDYADQSFDAVTCTQVLLYVEDIDRALGEMCRVLKPGGRIAILETDWRTAILHSSNPGLTDAVFRSWDESVPSPNLPVVLGKTMVDAGIAVDLVEAIPLLNTRYDMNNFSTSSIDWLARIAVKRGAMSREDAENWVADITAIGERDEYFFCVNRFLFSGIKSTGI